jgi:hypothetical protein
MTKIGWHDVMAVEAFSKIRAPGEAEIDTMSSIVTRGARGAAVIELPIVGVDTTSFLGELGDSTRVSGCIDGRSCSTGKAKEA